MTPPVQSDAAILRQTAARVREWSRGTTEGRRYSPDAPTHKTHAQWSAWPSSEYDEDEPEFAEELRKGACGVQVEQSGGVESITHRTPNWRDGRWIELVAPHIAGPLAAWLESAAEDAEQVGADRHAVAFARAVLGQTSSTTDDHEENR